MKTDDPKSLTIQEAARPGNGGGDTVPECEEEKLRRALTELSAIHEHAPIVMLLVDQDRRVCNVNGFAAEFVGRRPAEVIGMRGGEALRCLNHLDDPQGCGFGPACAKCNLRRAVLDTLETGISRHNVEAWLPYLHNGTRMERCLLISTAFLENRGAKKVLVCAQDITECKLAVEALRRSEQRLSAVLETQQEMICRFLPDTTLTFVNNAYCRVFGMSADELLGRKFLELVPTAEHEIILAKLSKIDKNNRISMCTHPVIQKDGTTGWQEWTDHAVLDAQGRVVELQSVGRDITRQKEAEDALRKIEMDQRILLDTIQTQIWYLANEYTYGAVNKARAALLGENIENIAFKTIYDFFPEDVADICRAGNKAVFETGKPVLSEEWVPNASRENRLLSILKTPKTDEQGRVEYVVCAAEDITERKQAESAKAELEAQNRQLKKAESLSRMAGAIAHYYNNLLSVVMGNLELAMADLPGNSLAAGNLTEAMSAARRAAEMGELMLAYLGQEIARREPLDLSETCRIPLQDFLAGMPEYIKMETELSSPGPVVNADLKRIRQILINLCTNALEAVDKRNGEIFLRVQTASSGNIALKHRFPIEFQPRPVDYALLEVADTGCGISEADIENIFDPFYSTRFTGRGLGLPAVLGVVKAHDGCITVESAPGRGSIFRVYLPITDDIATRPADQEIKHPTLPAGLTVLVVEDESLVRKMAGSMLRHLGMRVLEAGDGVEAVEVFQRNMNEIACVLCDLTMPRMNGWETIATLRELDPGIPVILTSGYDEAGVMSDAHAERPQVFLAKPYRMAALEDALANILSRRNI